MDLKSWIHLIGRRLQVSQQVVQALETLCKRLGANFSPPLIPAPGRIEELSETSPAVYQGLQIAQNTEGKILLFK